MVPLPPPLDGHWHGLVALVGLQFSYVEHNGRSYGKQVMRDPSSKLNLTSVFVKSDPFTWTLHIEGKTSGTSTAAVYFYLGIDSEFASDTRSQVGYRNIGEPLQ